MSLTARSRTLLRTVHVMVLAGAVGLVAVAGAPTNTPTTAGAASLAADTVVATTAPTTTAPISASTSTVPAVVAAPDAVVAATTSPGVGGSTARAQPTPPVPGAPAPVAPAPVAAAAVPVAPAPVAVVVPVVAPAAAAPVGDGVAVQAARAVFDATNAFRRQNGVAPLVWSAALQRSGHQHNLAMAGANQMAHQLPGEPSFDTRISDQGVPWLSVGENVGFNKNRTVAGALALHTMMINEVAPNDDHKVNKLDPLFTTLGVDVYLDTTTGKLWLTEDYAQI